DIGKFGGKVAWNVGLSKSYDRYFVNASGRDVFGEKAYTSLTDLPAVPELVLISIAAVDAVSSLREALALGTRAAIIFASGFAEAGDAGGQLNAEVLRLAAAHDAALLGPNCVGLANFAEGIFLCSGDGLDASPTDKDRAAKTCLIAQSGSLGL